MLDKFITPVIKPLLSPIVMQLDKRNIHADQVTLIGFFIGLLALPLLAMQLWIPALIAILINRILDGLDGQKKPKLINLIPKRNIPVVFED